MSSAFMRKNNSKKKAKKNIKQMPSQQDIAKAILNNLQATPIDKNRASIKQRLGNISGEVVGYFTHPNFIKASIEYPNSSLVYIEILKEEQLSSDKDGNRHDRFETLCCNPHELSYRVCCNCGIKFSDKEIIKSINTLDKYGLIKTYKLDDIGVPSSQGDPNIYKYSIPSEFELTKDTLFIRSLDL